MCYLDATPLLKLRNHFDFCYIYSSLELLDVHDQLYGNILTSPCHLTAASVAEFLCYRTSTLQVRPLAAVMVHAVWGSMFLVAVLLHKFKTSWSRTVLSHPAGVWSHLTV